MEPEQGGRQARMVWTSTVIIPREQNSLVPRDDQISEKNTQVQESLSAAENREGF